MTKPTTTTPQAITHRTLSGWIFDFASQPCQDAWPDITLSQRRTADLKHAFARAQQAGYNEIILWGLLCGRRWNPYLPDTFDAARKAWVLDIIATARQHRLKVLFGLGVYSWGFEDIIAHDPAVDGGTSGLFAMCGSRPEAQAHMREIIDFVMSTCDPDGLSMQSSDQGRCMCDVCQEQSAAEYHARINNQTCAYVHSRWPDKLTHLSTWGMNLGNPADMPHVQHMTAHADVLNDYNNSSARPDPAYRRTLISALPCAFGTEAGWHLDPPPFLPRDRWFIPLALRNLPYYHALAADGGAAIERYILPLANPGAEVGLLFDGLMFNDLTRDPHTALAEALSWVFEPRTRAATDALVDIWQQAEDGFLAHSRSGAFPQQIGLNQTHYNLQAPHPYISQRPEHLLRMAPAHLAAYADVLRNAYDAVRRVRPDVANQPRAADLERCVGLALADAQRVLAVRG
jgi:hypothetical protein